MKPLCEMSQKMHLDTHLSALWHCMGKFLLNVTNAMVVDFSIAKLNRVSILGEEVVEDYK